MRPFVCAAAALLAWPSLALATDGLAWKVDGPLRYHLDVAVQFPDMMWLIAVQNVEVRIVEIQVGVATTCTVAEAWKAGWELTCTLDDVALRAAPTSSEAGRAVAVLEEWDGLLTGGTVTMELSRDGRVRSFDLDQIPLGIEDRRTNSIREAMRVVLARAFAPFDLQLPKKGDDGGLGTWRQRESTTLGFPSEAGTVGSSVIEHTITDATGDTVDIATTAHGILGPSTTVSSPTSSSSGDRIANLFEMTLEGKSRFDRVQGHLIARSYKTRGELTASSVDAIGRAGYPYTQHARLYWLADDAPSPDLGGTGELEAVDRPTTTR